MPRRGTDWLVEPCAAELYEVPENLTAQKIRDFPGGFSVFDFQVGAHESASRSGERFSVKARFEKCRNTLCISSFSNRRIGGKDPPKCADAFARCCLIIKAGPWQDCTPFFEYALHPLPIQPARKRLPRGTRGGLLSAAWFPT